MSHGYKPVLWNNFKKRYDAILWLGIVGYLASFMTAGMLAWPGENAISVEILLIRALGTCAFLLLTIILCIGPLARLDKRFLPLLYNRRHFGVSMFLIAFLHFAIAAFWYHGFGELNPLLSMLVSNPNYDQIGSFPFESLGFVALLILFVMAATSHDFWLANLTAPVWKALHMGVYIAWALLVMHIALGILQQAFNPAFFLLLAASVVLVSGLHLVAAIRERRRDQAADADTATAMSEDNAKWIDVAHVNDIEEKRAKIIVLKEGADNGERIAVFRYDGKISAVGNACQHQNGPLGEGRIIDGCITCPWHGYQYKPEDGCSPEPFSEKIPTYRVKVIAGRIWLNPEALPPGTSVVPAVFDVAAATPTQEVSA